MTHSRIGWLVGLLAVALGWGCSPVAPAIVIVTPAHGTFTTAPSVSVTGVVIGIDPSVIADVRVNGVSVPLAPDMSFTTIVVLDAVAIANPIDDVLTIGAIGLGYVRTAHEAPDTRVTIEGLPARVAALPFVTDPG